MSVSLSASSLLESALLEELQDASSTSTTSTTSTASTAATTTTSTTDSDAATSSSQSQLTTDLATLLKDLFAGNVSDSKAALTQVQKDLQAENDASTSAADSTDASNSSSTTSTLSKLLGSISDSLSSGDTGSALNVLASFLISSGQTTGNLVNTTA